jgi:hypothetical protein
MSKDNIKLIETEFIQTWEEKEQRKKREFMDEMFNEKEILEKTPFFVLDIDDENLEDVSKSNQEIVFEGKEMMKHSLMSETQDLRQFIK